MKKFKVTYEDEIEAETKEEAYKRLLVVLASDVIISRKNLPQVCAFKFKEIK